MKHKNLLLLALLTILVTTAPRPAAAADASAGLDLSSAYVFRGVTLNDSWVAQPYFEVSGFPKIDGLSIGSWGNFDLNENNGGTPQSGQFSEVDLYANYDIPLESDSFGISLGYTEYLYPNSTAKADREFNLGLALDTVLSPSLTVFAGVNGAIQEQVYIEAALGHDIGLSDELALSLGGIAAFIANQADQSTADEGFSFASVSSALSYGCIAAGVTVYFETDDKVTIVDEEVVGTIGISGDF